MVAYLETPNTHLRSGSSSSSNHRHRLLTRCCCTVPLVVVMVPSPAGAASSCERDPLDVWFTLSVDVMMPASTSVAISPIAAAAILFLSTEDSCSFRYSNLQAGNDVEATSKSVPTGALEVSEAARFPGLFYSI
jgi:hypothetical protein